MVAVAALVAGVLLVLAAQAAHRLVHAFWFWRWRARPPRVAAPPMDLPSVTVQLPVYNERDVVAGLVDAVASLDWPPERLSIQLLDDSTDDTGAMAAGAIARARAAGLSVAVLRRDHRLGFKAGALGAGMAASESAYFAIFDADFRPQPDFLRRIMPSFEGNRVGMVQARWGHDNADASSLTAAQAVILDAHFTVEHLGRNRAGHWFNFNGTAGVWQRAAVEDAGGWQGDTLTEDLDLSYRAQLVGWRCVYRDDVVVPGALPSTMPALLAQQRRWAMGSIATLRKLGRRILRADAPAATKWEALVHLSGNLAWPLALLLAVLVPVLASLGKLNPAVEAAGLAAVLFGTSSQVLVFSLPGRRGAGDIALALALCLGLAASQTRAVFDALVAPAGEFVRTPKSGPRGTSYVDAVGPRLPIELILGGWQVVGLGAALAQGNLRSVPFLALLAAGFLWVGCGRTIQKRGKGLAALSP